MSGNEAQTIENEIPEVPGDPDDLRAHTLCEVRVVAGVESLTYILLCLRDAYAELGTLEGMRDAAFLQNLIRRVSAAIEKRVQRRRFDFEAMVGRAMLRALGLSLQPPQNRFTLLPEMARNWVVRADLRSMLAVLRMYYDTHERRFEGRLVGKAAKERWGRRWMSRAVSSESAGKMSEASR